MKPTLGRIVLAHDGRGANAAIVTRVHADSETYADGVTVDVFVFQRDAKGAGFVLRVPFGGPGEVGPFSTVPCWTWPPRAETPPLVVGDLL